MNNVNQSFKFNKGLAELEKDDWLELEFNDLPAFLEHYGIKRIYRAKNQAYQFDVLDDQWQLGLKETMYLKWMWNANLSPIVVLMFRVALARNAESLAPNSIEAKLNGLKKIRFSLNIPYTFQESYYLLSTQNKKSIFGFFSKIKNDDSPRYQFLEAFFTDVITFFSDVDYPEQRTQGQYILDPVKGMYSEDEALQINTALRLSFVQRLQVCAEGVSYRNKDLNGLGTVIAVALNKSIFRRWTQLVELKWIDVLPVGFSFTSHRKVSSCDLPIEEHLFSDVEELHIRTFRGKNGEFRKQAEPRSHRIEPDFSRIILQYRIEYQRRLEACLIDQDIHLNKDEMKEVMFQLPVFPGQELFTVMFDTKQTLFQSLSYLSEAFHKTDNALQATVATFAKSLNLISERTSKALTLSNNRFRHTVLTNGAWNELDDIALSKITGVTPLAVTPYIDLSTESRLKIDKAFAGKKIFKQFGMLSVGELSQSEQFKIMNEFGEEQGVLHKALDCSTCASKLGRPIGCYGCNNFRPHVEANHKKNLEKAQKKLIFNQEGGGSPVTIRKLEKSIIYIQATMQMCNEYHAVKRGITDEWN